MKFLILFLLIIQWQHLWKCRFGDVKSQHDLSIRRISILWCMVIQLIAIKFLGDHEKFTRWWRSVILHHPKITGTCWLNIKNSFDSASMKYNFNQINIGVTYYLYKFHSTPKNQKVFYLYFRILFYSIVEFLRHFYLCLFENGKSRNVIPKIKHKDFIKTNRFLKEKKQFNIMNS